MSYHFAKIWVGKGGLGGKCITHFFLLMSISPYLSSMFLALIYLGDTLQSSWSLILVLFKCFMLAHMVALFLGNTLLTSSWRFNFLVHISTLFEVWQLQWFACTCVCLQGHKHWTPKASPGGFTLLSSWTPRAIKKCTFYIKHHQNGSRFYQLFFHE